MAKQTFETALEQLEESVNQLETGSLTLEEALTSFENGIRWSRECHRFLEKAEKRVEVILKNEKGEHTQTVFDLEDQV
ncbi:MAG: exodeoxyribonuclease VII small subunit [SAR324 cluster bacterium]|nr:exodeoxyribonuclease VII small subunit [SAR324 cluster bacterium]